MSGMEDVVERVRDRYGKIARGKASGCCGPTSLVAVEIGYAAEDLSGAVADANLGLGCGAPVGHLDLRSGETVLDLGSGAGIDCFLASRAVGGSGRVIGVDMTPEMVERARANAVKGGFANVDFRLGRLESLPVEDASVDAVTSNCVINLVPDKALVFREVARVLKPGGRVVVSDIVLDGELPEAVRESVLAYVGCVAGAMRREDYLAAIDLAGLGPVEILKDFDYLGAGGYALASDFLASLDGTGTRLEDLAGIVRSVTWRARRRDR